LGNIEVPPVPEASPDDSAGPASLQSGLEWQSSSDARVRARVANFALRIAQATCLLRGQPVPLTAGETPLVEEFAKALATSPEPASRLAWLALVVSDARYPTEGELQKAIRSLRTAGSDALAAEVVRRFEIALAEMRAPEFGLDVRRHVVLIDITHTASHDLHTGIQRVVRQVCARWFAKAEVVPVYWNQAEGVLRTLAPSERERMMRWAEHMHEGGSAFGGRLPEEDTGASLVPWGSRLIIPELSAEAPRCDGYRALAISEVLSGLSYLAYDLIPISAPETVAEGMPGAFANYLSNVKYADRLSAISDASAIDYRAFTTALASQGLSGPEVAAHLLPVDDPLVDPLELVSLDAELGLADAPLVLVVGSHEPRKNHLTVLDAAEELWGRGHWFHLVFMGGSGWRDEGFNTEVERLRNSGLPVRVLKRVSEGQLWAGYARARFTIFPSIVEGFGLPIVESLRCGTPVITSNYGSMAEVAVGGGAVLVDPRDPKDLVKAMEELLTSAAVLETLEKEAMARCWKTWDEYADEVWAHLAPESTGSNANEPEASSV
jgi:glycosyltransferase involved in cell wall biosynthesis